jgi:hypothetical protein
MTLVAKCNFAKTIWSDFANAKCCATCVGLGKGFKEFFKEETNQLKRRTKKQTLWNLNYFL